MRNALPAAMVWIIICLLKGDVYTCAFWPAESLCDDSGEPVPVAPCKIPQTINTELETCDQITARNLKSQS